MAEPKRRLRSCVEAWPGCETGEYNPACCRFPKSCSADVYDPARVTEDDLEPPYEPPAPAERELCRRGQLCVLDAGHDGGCSVFTPEALAALSQLAAATTRAFQQMGAAWINLAREVVKTRERTQRDFVLHPPPREEDPDGPR